MESEATTTLETAPIWHDEMNSAIAATCSGTYSGSLPRSSAENEIPDFAHPPRLPWRNGNTMSRPLLVRCFHTGISGLSSWGGSKSMAMASGEGSVSTCPSTWSSSRRQPERMGLFAAANTEDGSRSRAIIVADTQCLQLYPTGHEHRP